MTNAAGSGTLEFMIAAWVRPFHASARAFVRKRAFTLLELLVVMTIFIIIAMFVIYALNIRLSFRKTYDTERAQHARALTNAQMQYLINNWVILKENEIPQGEANAKPICTDGVTDDPTCVNLDDLTPDFLVALPRDRAEPNPNYTGFSVYQSQSQVIATANYLGVVPGESTSSSSSTAPSSASSLAVGLVGHWTFDEGTGIIANDATSHMNHGTLTNMEPATDWVAGVPRSFPNPYALDFASNDRVLIPDDDSLEPQLMTLAAWVHADTLPSSYNTIIDKRYSGIADSYSLKLDAGGQIELCLEPEVGTGCLLSTGSAVSTGVWTHVAATWDGSVMRVFKNGVQDAATGARTAAIVYDSSDLLIGMEDEDGTPQQFFDGRIDDVRIYNRALSPAEVAALAAL